MLGSEYNWLVSFTRPSAGAPKVSLSRNGLLTLAVAVFCLLCVALGAEPPHRQLLRDAAAAAKAGDNALFVAKLEAARDLRPDYPRVLLNLARGYTAAGRLDDALAQLRELSAMGLTFDLTQEAAFAPLHGRPEFVALTHAFASNQNETGRDEAAFAITDVDGIIEGFACHPVTLEWYFSDVHNRCVWHRDVSNGTGRLKRFSADADGLLGVFGLKIDVVHNSLWAGTAALPEMKGYAEADKGRAALLEFDLGTGRVRRAFAVPADGRDHVLGDLLLTPDGSVFATDSTAPVIWRLAPRGTKLEKWLESSEFVSLQGLALGADGKSLVVADYANGLWRIDLGTHAASLLPPPAHTTLFGIDGIYGVPGGLVAVQNGLSPQRVVRIALGADGRPTGATVLRAGHAAMTDLALGEVISGRFHFIANSGWALFEDPKAAPAPRNVTILSTPL